MYNLVGYARSILKSAFIMGCAVLGLHAQAEIPAMTSHFPLDDTGTEVVDAISGAKGTLATGSEWIEGKHGGAMAVKAGTHIPSDTAFDFAEESFSIAYWQRVPTSHSAHHPHPLTKGDYDTSELAGGIRWEFHAQKGSFHFTIDDGTNKHEASAPDGSFFTGEWVHVVGIRDTEQKKLLLYADGALVGSADDGAGSIANQVDLVIGDASKDDNFMPGDLDDIRFFRLVLTEEQIAAVMEAKETVFIKNRRVARRDDILTFLAPGLNIYLTLENSDFHSIEIIDIYGRVLRALPVSPEIVWDGSDKSGAMAESGVYVVRLLGKGCSYYQRIILAH